MRICDVCKKENAEPFEVYVIPQDAGRGFDDFYLQEEPDLCLDCAKGIVRHITQKYYPKIHKEMFNDDTTTEESR